MPMLCLVLLVLFGGFVSLVYVLILWLFVIWWFVYVV